MNKLPNLHVFTGTEPKNLYVSAVGGDVCLEIEVSTGNWVVIKKIVKNTEDAFTVNLESGVNWRVRYVQGNDAAAAVYEA